MNTQPRSTWVFKAVLVFVAAILVYMVNSAGTASTLTYASPPTSIDRDTGSIKDVGIAPALPSAASTFTPITPTLPSGWVSGRLNGVWGSSASNVYAVGSGYTGSTNMPLLYHYDGIGWTPITPTLPSDWTEGYLYDVWGSNASNVYAVGYGYTGSTNMPLLYHYDGIEWTLITPTLPSGLMASFLHSAWGSSASDVYAVGGGNSGGTDVLLLYHYDGIEWTPITATLPGGWTYGSLYDAWGSSASDVYAVGGGSYNGFFYEPLVYHYNGTGWTSITPTLPSGWTDGTLNGAWGSNASNIYAVGNGSNGPLIYHYDGNEWTPITATLSGGSLFDTWGSSASDVYAVGEGYTGGTNVPLLYHYDGIEWTPITPTLPSDWTMGSLFGVWGSSTSKVYAVGYGNNAPLIYHTMCSASITVKNANDDGADSLRQAMADVCDGGTINFDSDYNIVLSSGTLTATKSMTITGENHHITVDGNQQFRVMYVNNGVTLSLNTLTIRNGVAVNGGGISNDGALTLNASILISNTASNTGGGIASSGALTVSASAVVNNTASDNGGGIVNFGGTLTLNNSTLSGNKANGVGANDGGGAINQYGGTPSLIINNSTIADNTAASPNEATSGIWLETGVLKMTNSIVANNSITNNLKVESGSTFTSQGYNLSNDWNGQLTDPTDLTGDPLLSSLADHGGSTWTYALLPGSPAIDAVGISSCSATTDQRGVARPQGSQCDIGAFEANQYTLTINTAGNGSGVVTPEVGTHSYLSGTLVPITATANTGSTFTDWSGDLTGSVNPTDITLNGNKAVTATFTLNIYVITPTASTGGNITPSMPQTVNYGDSITFTIVADTGYHIAEVGVDGISQAAVSSYTFFNVTADHTITAAFTLNPPAGLSAINNSPTPLGSVTTLTATITNSINVTYAWSFGDGRIGAGATVTHTYTTAGTYTAVVTATNSAGSLTATTLVRITASPIANAGPDQTVRTGRSVTLNGSASSDPGNFLPLAYHWQQIGGPTVTLIGASNVTATFTSPVVTQTHVLTFALAVTNTQSIASQPDLVVIAIEPYRNLLPLILK